MNICICITVLYPNLSYEIGSRSEIMPCNKINKPLVDYRFTGNVMRFIYYNVAYKMTQL